METTITFINKNSFLKQFSGIILVLISLVLILQLSLFGLFFLIAGLSLLIKNGTEINYENKKYRDIYQLFGIKLGKWKPLPEFEYISIFNAKLKYKTGLSMSIEHEFKDSIYRIQLFYNTNQKIIVFETKNKSKAFEKAKFLADVLNLNILDATEQESKWIDK